MEGIAPDALDDFLDREADARGSYDLAWERAEAEFGISRPPVAEMLSGAIMARIAAQEALDAVPEPEIFTRIAAAQDQETLAALYREIAPGVMNGVIPYQYARQAYVAVRLQQAQVDLQA